uniref:protein-tyrosine-phosphatase n=1 Tax=Caenorhabditis japonica TaxID=281687 RepID=A0A8R1HPE5_CAEJA
MDTVLREFLKEEESYSQQDYLTRFYKIRVEQEKIRAEPEYRSDCAVAPQHYARNRYRDILPYDHNRVEIQKDEENPEGYMNASFITLPGGKSQFIAAQAPLPTTLDEWWKMIDEHGVSLILILCKLVELNKIKCERYWPETVGECEIFGDYEITLEEERTFDDDEYLLRVLKMENQTNGETRVIHQLHYREWPDHGCPSGEKQLLNMIDLMESIHEESTSQAPILVHCSAGVGRTGTIIAINYIREQMKAETLSVIDVFGLVMTLRKQRASMVQTQDQYQFVHRCIASYCRRHLGIESKPDDLSVSQIPLDSSTSVRLIAPPTPTINDQIGTYHPDVSTEHVTEDDSDASSVPDFPDEPPAPKGPEDLGSSAAF